MDGILLLNKPQNMTSHDCVNLIRKLMHTKKVGHIGTLDPLATGVLPICINDATKIIQFIDKADKEYIATIYLGYSTTTMDRSGEIVEKDDTYKTISRELLLDTLKKFIGKQKQTPPLFSAVKVKGKKLYEYARDNIPVNIASRDIEIYSIELLSSEEVFSGKEIIFSIRIFCSKGTYIRTLANDIGKILGSPSHLYDLIRTKSGAFSLEDCYSFSEIEKGNYHLVSIYDALSSYPRIEVTEDIKLKVIYGQKINLDVNNFTKVVLCDKFKNVLAVYEKEGSLFRPIRVLAN
ncbi:MAG TPA: tRNA pseudouridine(55) synthase TruB [Haloplasmataceae bacterium]